VVGAGVVLSVEEVVPSVVLPVVPVAVVDSVDIAVVSEAVVDSIVVGGGVVGQPQFSSLLPQEKQKLLGSVPLSFVLNAVNS